MPFGKKTLSNSAVVDIPLILLNEQESISLIKNKKGNMWEWRDDDCSNRKNIIKRFPFNCEIHFEFVLSSQMKTPSINRVFDVSPHFNTKTGICLNSLFRYISRLSQKVCELSFYSIPWYRT